MFYTVLSFVGMTLTISWKQMPLDSRNKQSHISYRGNFENDCPQTYQTGAMEDF